MIKTLVQLFVLGFLVYNLFEKEDLYLVSYLFLFSGVFLFMYSLYVYGFMNFFDAILNNSRLGAEISQENTFGGQAALSFIASVHILLFDKKNIILKFLVVIASLMSLLLVAASASKSALIQVALGTIILLFLRYKLGLKFLSSTIILIIVGYFILQLPIFSMINERLFSMINSVVGDGKDASTDGMSVVHYFVSFIASSSKEEKHLFILMFLGFSGFIKYN